MAEGKNVTVEEFDGIFLVREQTVERKFSDHTSINRFVVSEAILKCLLLIRDCFGKDSVLYGYNTDGIYITNPKKSYKNKKDVKFSTKKIGRAYVTDSVLVYFEKHFRENMVELDEVEFGRGMIYNGQAGSGRTTKLCEKVFQAENPIVLSFTNKAVENVKDRLIKNGHRDLITDCHTFDSYFCEWHGRDIKSLKDKTVFIEEFTMVPNKWMTLIYKAFVMFGIKIYMFGDPNQCEPVEGGSQINYDYLYSKIIKQMCPRRKTLKYIEDSCRYDKQTHEILSKFLIHGKVSYDFDLIDQKYYKNICYLNKTRIEVNTKCCDNYVEGKQYEIVKFKYNNKAETYKVCIGMPVLATTNIKDKEIFNTMEFTIEDIKDDRTDDRRSIRNFKINDIWFDIKEFSESFIPSFCVTVYKYQGADINEPYNIYDVNKMDKKQLYTALSRTTKLEYIHLNNKEVNNKYVNRRQPLLELMNAKFISLYKNGKIYQVTFDDEKIYVGSTCEELETRLSWHLTNPQSQVYKNKNKNPKIELIVNAPSGDKKSLEKVENEHIYDFSKIYGKKLINIKENPNIKPKKIEYQVSIENQQQLEERIAKLDNKLKIKDNTKNNFWYIDSVINGERHATKARYTEDTKDDALTNISKKKQEIIEKLTIYFE